MPGHAKGKCEPDETTIRQQPRVPALGQSVASDDAVKAKRNKGRAQCTLRRMTGDIPLPE